jgi:hypothetical protein
MESSVGVSTEMMLGQERGLDNVYDFESAKVEAGMSPCLIALFFS